MTKSCAYGQLFRCDSCNKIHLEFNNIGIDFYNIEILNDFKNYLGSIDASGFEFKNRKNHYRRKILIPFPNTTIKMLMTSGEIDELKKLIDSFVSENLKIGHTSKSIKKISSVSFKDLNLN